MSILKLCVVTGSRAEYHLLSPLLRRLAEDNDIDLRIAVTGSHLSEAHGFTYRDIEADGFTIDGRIQILEGKDDAGAINHAIARAIIGFSDYFEESNPDAVLVLGDRYELLGVATAAMNLRIPLVHLHGGETTEGAVDEAIRHSLSKMSYLHFTSCEDYRRRVIQLGEDPSRVFNVGALGVENILNCETLSREELYQSIDKDLGDHFAVVTFHPVTLEEDTAAGQINELFAAIEQFPEMSFLFTKSNADSGGLVVNQEIDRFAAESSNVHAVTSLGLKRYLSALSLADMVIGNSSSGIIETPSFGVPTVNIGNRQKGRIQAANIINCEPTRESIIQAMEEAQSPQFMALARAAENPYGDGRTSEVIVEVLKESLLDKEINLMKKFYDRED